MKNRASIPTGLRLKTPIKISNCNCGIFLFLRLSKYILPVHAYIIDSTYV